MDMRLVRWVITGLILSGFVVVLSGCVSNTRVWHETPVWNLPDEVKAKVSIGDTRQEVRSILGEPLIDVRSHGVEVYRRNGRDLNYVLVFFLPFPDFGKEVTVGILILYDDNDIVKYISNTIITNNHDTLRITAGGYRYIYNSIFENETLFGPSISRDELRKMKPIEGACSLVLLMDECPMEYISLDNKRIYDLSPAGMFCDQIDSDYHGTFVQRYISPGDHQLNIHQKTLMKNRELKTAFECKVGDTVYIELDGVRISDKWWTRLEGEITVRENLPESSVDGKGRLSPILWHKGAWYGPPDNTVVGE